MRLENEQRRENLQCQLTLYKCRFPSSLSGYSGSDTYIAWIHSNWYILNQRSNSGGIKLGQNADYRYWICTKNCLPK